MAFTNRRLEQLVVFTWILGHEYIREVSFCNGYLSCQLIDYSATVNLQNNQREVFVAQEITWQYTWCQVQYCF